MTLTAVILTFNEARHIERALRSVAPIAERLLVVDSGSTDDTAARARALGATVLTHPFVNQARQFNWALDQLPADTGWVLRLDADEIVSGALATEIATRLPALPAHVTGLTLPRHIVFLGRRIRHGGVSPTPVLRLFRHGRGRSEDRWMDEHITVDGTVAALSGALTDDNRNPLGWWIDKHNRYASREALQILLTEDAAPTSTSASTPGTRRIGPRAATTRWLKDHLYARTPTSLRALAYFLYRYLLRGGFRDGYPGLAFHVLQGFWYRFLVDAKLHEARAHRAATGADLSQTAYEILGLAPRPRSRPTQGMPGRTLPNASIPDPEISDPAPPDPGSGPESPGPVHASPKAPPLHLGPNTSRPAATRPGAAAGQGPTSTPSQTAQTKEPPDAAPHLSLLR